MSSGGTLYVISSGEVATSTALFRAVVEKLHRDCVYAGTFTRYHRIPNPVLFALDEVTQTAQVPLDQWLATSAGSGIQVCYVVHTPAQLRARYGTALADAIWALTGTKIVLGGNSDEQMGSEISRLCGQVPAGEGMRPAVPEAYIRQLPESRALVIAMNRSPLAVKVRPVWRRITFRLGLNPAPFVTPVRPVLPDLAIADLPEVLEEHAA